MRFCGTDAPAKGLRDAGQLDAGARDGRPPNAFCFGFTRIGAAASPPHLWGRIKEGGRADLNRESIEAQNRPLASATPTPTRPHKRGRVRLPLPVPANSKRL